MSKLIEFSRPQSSHDLLNEQQRAAVQHGEGPLLVVAGAGSGKTRVITERIRYLLESNPRLAGENILGLTFTDKAAAEMKSRVVRDAGDRAKSVCLGTFHSFCFNEILLSLNPGFQVIEDVDHWILLRKNMPLLVLDRFRRLAEPGQFLGDFVQFFSRCQDELVTPDDYQGYADRVRAKYESEKATLAGDAQLIREEEVARLQEIARVYRTSDRLLRERGLLTFGMLLLETVKLLSSDPELRKRMQSRYRYVLVDEFQDTNIAQLELLWLVAGGHRNIVAVGDDDQAIYRFRGASFGSFTIFLRFAGAQVASGDYAECLQPLTLNYRSSARLLRVAGQVIAQNEKSPVLPKKELTAQKPEGEKIRIVELASAEEEAHWIADELERLHGATRRWSAFAVLYRMHSHRNVLVETFAMRGIPFVIRNLSILGNTLIRDVLAYLRLISVPSDNVACARVLSAPGWGLEPSDLVRLCERTTKSKGLSLWDALQAAQDELPFTKDRKRPGELVAFIEALRKRAKRLSVTELLDELTAGLSLSVETTRNDRKYLDRFTRFVQEWERKNEDKQLADFVQYLEYFQQAGGQINLDEEATSEAVQLMTVHIAKGLEFDHVFVMRLVRGAFPAPAQKPVLEFPDELMKEEKPTGDFHIQEERRLFYVAMTRARERLTLTSVINKRSKPSLFLDDILINPQIARTNVQQLAPRISLSAREAVVEEGTASPLPTQPSLFDSLGQQARVYSRIARWAESYRPPVFEPLQLSASAIDTYAACPQKYLFARVWGIREGPQAATSFGNVIHTTIRHFIAELRKARAIPFEELEGIFQREWTSAGFEDTYQESEYKKAGVEQLRGFHATCVANPPEVIGQEKYFELHLDNNVVITGRIDQVNCLGPGQHEIVDYKTGRPRLESHAKKSLQLSIYALAAREVLGLNATRLVFYNLQTNSPLVTTRDEKQLSQAQQTVQEVAADIRARQFPTRVGFACKFCEFRAICPAHEQKISIQPAGK